MNQSDALRRDPARVFSAEPLPDLTDEQRAQTTSEAARISALGHDLRAAVSDIIGGLRLIDQSALDEGVQLQLERIRSAGEVLARLLEESLAAMIGDEASGAPGPANLHMQRFLRDLDMRWSGRAAESGLRFAIDATPDLPTVIAVDRIALERILSNTISNAIKYTDTGEVALSVAVLPCQTLRFVVSDTGAGFSDAALDRLFEFRGRPDNEHRPGTGLGMHISRDMAHRLGAEISVANRAEGGAAVTLALPPETWRPGPPDSAMPLPDLSAVKVLLAEDSPTNQLLIGRMLSDMGAEVAIASDGVEAIHWLDREDFDIALIDIEMPRLSGIDVIRASRSKDRQRANMPIVAVTAYVLRANRDAIYAAGADAILSKPVAGIEALGLAIRAAIDKHHGRAGTSDAEPLVDLVRAETFQHLMQVAGPDAASELLDRLVTDLERTRAGLAQGLDADDRAAVRSETHVLIALAGAVGAEGLQRLSETLNASAHRSADAARAALGTEALGLVDRLIAFIQAERRKRAGIK